MQLGFKLRAANALLLLTSVFGEASQLPEDAKPQYGSGENGEALTELTDASIGIDLGTTFSAVYIYDHKNKEMFPLPFSSDGKTVLPSTVYASGLNKDGKPIMKVGYEADALNRANPQSNAYFYGHKRIIGVPDLNSDPRIKDFQRSVTYKVEQKKDNSGNPYLAFPVYIDGKPVTEVTPTSLATLVLSHIFRVIERKGFRPVNVVITTPAYFTGNQDTETRVAAQAAGFTNVVIAKEPIAACVTYSKTANMPLDEEENVMVFDFGGGTLDVTVVEVVKEKDDEASDDITSRLLGKGDDGTTSTLSVSKLVGDNFLGGENVNKALTRHFIKKIPSLASRNEQEKDESYSREMLRLHLFAEEFKIALCSKKLKAGEQAVSHKAVFTTLDKKDYEFEMTDAEFDAVVSDVYRRVEDLFLNPSTGLFRKSKGNEIVKSIDPEAIKKVILVGGSTRIPYIRKMLKKLCPKSTLYYGVDADMAVAQGACYISMSRTGDTSLVLTNVAPLSVGIAVANGYFQPIIKKDSKIPTFAVMPFTTVYDNQREVLLEVAEGIRPLFKDNALRGKFTLGLKTPAPAGVPKIEVRIDYYSDYTLRVTATDVSTGESMSQKFKAAYAHSDKSKIDEILAVAKEKEAEDLEVTKKYEALRTLRETVDMFSKQIEISKIGEEDKLYFEAVTKGYKDWIDKYAETATSSLVEGKLEELKQEVDKFAAKMREGAGAPQEPTEAPKEEEQTQEKTAGREAL